MECRCKNGKPFDINGISLVLSFENNFPTTLTLEQREVIVGCSLGDLHIWKHSTYNAQLQFAQSTVHSKYLMHLYSIFNSFCKSEPKVQEISLRVTGKSYSRVRFQTRTSSLFSEFHSFFFKDGNKIVPSNIGDLLTARSLAYWSMDDGSKASSGFLLSTQSFSEAEVNLLCSVLLSKFDINCNIRKQTGYVIYIRANSMERFRALVLPYFNESMVYKLKSNVASSTP